MRWNQGRWGQNDRNGYTNYRNWSPSKTEKEFYRLLQMAKRLENAEKNEDGKSKGKNWAEPTKEHWACPSCPYQKNFTSRDKCWKCGTARPNKPATGNASATGPTATQAKDIDMDATQDPARVKLLETEIGKWQAMTQDMKSKGFGESHTATLSQELEQKQAELMSLKPDAAKLQSATDRLRQVNQNVATLTEQIADKETELKALQDGLTMALEQRQRCQEELERYRKQIAGMDPPRDPPPVDTGVLINFLHGILEVIGEQVDPAEKLDKLKTRIQAEIQTAPPQERAPTFPPSGGSTQAAGSEPTQKGVKRPTTGVENEDSEKTHRTQKDHTTQGKGSAEGTITLTP